MADFFIGILVALAACLFWPVLLALFIATHEAFNIPPNGIDGVIIGGIICTIIWGMLINKVFEKNKS